MRPFYLLSLLILAACGVKHSSVDYGKTTVANLIQEKGAPLKEEPIPVKEGKILHYSPDEKYQVKGEIVTNGFKAPRGDQKTLIYWKHQFRDCQTRHLKISGGTNNHELPEYELACDEQGVSVVYTEGSEFVSRVTEYEKK